MSLTNGQQALIKRIVEMTTSANIMLPNGPGKTAPRYVIQEAGGAQRTRTIDGVTEAFPEIVVLVETKSKYTTDNNSLVAALVARFPVNARFDGVQILDAPLPRPPLPVVEGIYSVPVIIRGYMSF